MLASFGIPYMMNRCLSRPTRMLWLLPRRWWFGRRIE